MHRPESDVLPGWIERYLPRVLFQSPNMLQRSVLFERSVLQWGLLFESRSMLQRSVLSQRSVLQRSLLFERAMLQRSVLPQSPNLLQRPVHARCKLPDPNRPGGRVSLWVLLLLLRCREESLLHERPAV